MAVKSVDKLPPRNINIYNINQLNGFRTTQINTERHTQTKYNNFLKIFETNPSPNFSNFIKKLQVLRENE